MKKILEVGPGLNPMHHRQTDDLKELESGDRVLRLENDEEYTALDQPRVSFNHRIWQTAKETYGDRVHFVNGDRVDIPFDDESFDELVSLGSHHPDGKIISEFRRVLKTGGILRLGTTKTNSKRIMDTWGKRLERLGFTFLKEEVQEYRYAQRKGLEGCTYTVLVFRKGDKK